MQEYQSLCSSVTLAWVCKYRDVLLGAVLVQEPSGSIIPSQGMLGMLGLPCCPAASVGMGAASLYLPRHRDISLL